MEKLQPNKNNTNYDLPLSLDLNSFKIINENYDIEFEMKEFKELNDFYHSINYIYEHFYKEI